MKRKLSLVASNQGIVTCIDEYGQIVHYVQRGITKLSDIEKYGYVKAGILSSNILDKTMQEVPFSATLEFDGIPDVNKPSVTFNADKGYKINKLVMTKLSKVHIPYISFMEIEGRRGGVYLLDEFNIEQLIKEIADNQFISILSGSIHKMCMDIGINVVYEARALNDKTLKIYADHCKKYALIRKSGMAKTSIIANELNCKQKAMIINYV